MKACATAVALMLLVAGTAAAQDQRAFLSLLVNGVEQDDALVLLRGTDALIPVAALERAGLHDFGGTRETVDGMPLVSLASLAPRLTFRVDEVELLLAITADPALLGTLVRNLEGGPPEDIIYRNSPSAFVNYAATAGAGDEYEVITETGISARGAFLSSTATRTQRGTVRGLSSLTFDRRTHMQRWTVGDTFANGGLIGGDALVAGIGVAREFSLSPYFVRHPTMSVTTPVTTPSVVEVYVNGRLVREEQVQPGRLDLRNLPMTTGRNETRLVLRDPFGGQREITSGFYLTGSALAKGIQEYQYTLGWRRGSFGTESWDYREPVAIARHRIGLTDVITGGLRLEGRRDLISGGPTLNLRLPVGEIELAAGMSRSQQTIGSAGQASYVFASTCFSGGATLARTDREYGNVSLNAGDPRAERLVSAFGSVPTGHASSLTVQYSRTTGVESVTQSRASLLGSARLARFLDVVASVTRVRGFAGSGTEASIGLTTTIGPRTVASVSAQRTVQGTDGVFDLQRPLPVGTGFGYQVRAGAGERTSLSGVAQYQGNYGRYELRRDDLGSTARTTVNVSGALVAIGGGLHATRAVRNSYALVRVPGVAGVRAYASNQEVGRTGDRGTLLIPDLLAYYGNRLSISDSDIPVDYQVSQVQMTLAPPFRGGAVAQFPVLRIQRVTGSVVLQTAQGERVPAYGSMSVAAAGGRKVSPLGASGEFYFENIGPGRHDALVMYGEATCALTIDVARTTDPVVTVGKVICRDVTR